MADRFSYKGDQADLKPITVRVQLGLLIRTRLPYASLNVSLSAQNNTMRHLLEAVADRTEGKIERFLFEKDRKVLSGLMVKTGKTVYTGTELNQKEIRLEDGDVVELLYYISGG